ncbi:MAG TPA: PAS domain S-box protein [Syntrophomonas sp.]|nr:PAS domain S-box protein [Syntrophomonas sp.]HPT70084.1 PAS domain S-box protein [Syntrophomonas sp.]
MSENSKILADLQDENVRLRKKIDELESRQLNLREKEIAFINLTETIPASIHVLQGNHFCYVNQFFSGMTGYSMEECLQINFWDIVHPDYQDVIRERAWARQKGEEVVPVREFKIIAKSGHELWVDHFATNTIWQGKPAVMAVLHDLTERKHIEARNYQQHHQLEQTHAELEEANSELQSSQSSLLEINARLRESEERLELALWAADESLWDWNLETGYLYFGDLEVNKLGYQGDKIDPHISSWIKRVHPDDISAVEAAFALIYKGVNDYYEAEYRLLSKSGEWVWILDRGKVINRNKTGKAQRMIGTKRFIDKEKAIREALQKSETRYRTLVETIPEIVAHNDLRGNYLWVNEHGMDFFGKDVYQHNFRDYLISHEDYKQTLSIIIPLLQNNQTAQWETLLKRQDGEFRLLKWQSKIISENGKLTGILSTARDITEMREAELNLTKSEAQYRRLFEKSPVGLIKIGSNGDILDANEYYVRISGAPSKEAVTGINIFNAASSREDLASIINRIFKKYQSSINIFNEATSWSDIAAIIDKALNKYKLSEMLFTEINYISKWGVPLCMQYRIEPLTDEDNHFQHILVACEEISERKEAEARIRYLSYNDCLTGLYNRAFFDDELLRLDSPEHFPLSIIMGDVNGLKLVNDTFGHSAGDILLQNIAHILRDCCRSEDIVARWGGDEFVILLPRTSSLTAYSICERIRTACKEGRSDPIQASIALGTASKESFYEDVNKVITEAEDAMYRKKLLEKRSTRNAIITSLETSLHEKTMETREHAQRIQNICIQFGRALDLPDNEIDRLALLARLHDIGKIGIADEILNKPGELSTEEWLEIRKHPEIGYRIVYASHELAAIAEEILYHHERWDGSGYPEGLKAYEIPFLARILSIADAYDVLTHARSYKGSLSHDQATQEIIRCSGTQFEPELVEVFLGLFK